MILLLCVLINYYFMWSLLQIIILDVYLFTNNVKTKEYKM